MNGKSIETLLNNIADIRRLVFFAGAGISVSAGYPLWDRATEMAINSAAGRGLSPEAAAYARQKCNKRQFYEAFDILKSDLPEAAFYQITGEIFRGRETTSEAHQLMVQVDCRGIITTNLDECLGTSRILLTKRQPLTDVSSAPAGDQYFIVQPHGTLQRPREMVLTPDDWRRVEQNPDLLNLLAYVVSQHQLMFVGYSLKDPDFMRIWERLLRERVFRAPALYCAPAGGLEPSLINEFREKNIQVIEFPDDGSFAFVTEVLKALTTLQPAKVPVIAASLTTHTVQDLEGSVLLCLQFSPTREGRLVLVSKALILSYCATTTARQISRQELLNYIVSVLGQDSPLLTKAALTALEELASQHLITLVGTEIHIQRDALATLNRKAESFGRAQQDWAGSTLTQVAYELRTRVDPGDQESIVELFDIALLESGRAVAELLLFNRPPGDEPDRVEQIARTYCEGKSLLSKQDLYTRTIKQMLFEPSEHEEGILFNKLQAYFISSAYVLNPTSERLLVTFARDHVVYFDSSIILPALAIGHPSFQVYRRILLRTQALGMRLRVLRDMVNEVWANVRTAERAFREFSQTGTPLQDVLEAYVAMYGSGNGNVFLEGFVNRHQMDPSLTPAAYTSSIFGSTGSNINEAQVIAAIQSRLNVECDTPVQSEFDPIRLESVITSIEHLRKQGGRYKSRLLCEHEARQFYLIHLRREQDPSLRSKIWYVTTDRFVPELQRLERETYPLPIAYTPRNWFQYLDLIDVDSRGSRHFARLQPMMRFGVVSGDIGIDAIRMILREQHDLLETGLVSAKELAETAVQEYHVRQAIEEYDRNTGTGRQDEVLKTTAKERVKSEMRKAVGGFVALRKEHVEELKREKDEALQEAVNLRRRLAKKEYIVKTLQAQQKPRKKVKRRH